MQQYLLKSGSWLLRLGPHVHGNKQKYSITCVGRKHVDLGFEIHRFHYLDLLYSFFHIWASLLIRGDKNWDVRFFHFKR